LRVENFGCVHLRGCDTLAETGDFTDLLEEEYIAGSIAVNTDAGRVVTTILLAGETVAKDITNFLAILTITKHNQLPVSRTGGMLYSTSWRSRARKQKGNDLF
jgi:hypothetical protein